MSDVDDARGRLLHEPEDEWPVLGPTPSGWGWERVTDEQGDPVYDLLDEEGVSIIESACFVRDDATNDRHRALLAAAPELLAVVRQVFDLHEASVYEGCLRDGVPERAAAVARVADILDQARAAIARATGGAS